MGHATDIVGYTFHTEQYCPEHVLDAVRDAYPRDYPLGWSMLPGETTESILGFVARQLDIDHEDEHSYDSGEFPKVIFRDSAHESGCGDSDGCNDRCATCHEPLGVDECPVGRRMSEYDALEQYRDMLDECCETVKIGNLEYDPSRVLEAVDPIAFRVGFSEWCDAEGIEVV